MSEPKQAFQDHWHQFDFTVLFGVSNVAKKQTCTCCGDFSKRSLLFKRGSPPQYENKKYSIRIPCSEKTPHPFIYFIMFRKVEPIRRNTEELLVQKSRWISATVLNNMFYEYEWLNLIQTKKKNERKREKEAHWDSQFSKKISLFPMRPESNIVH